MSITRWEPFRDLMSFPVTVQSEKAEAVFENWVLTLTLPKAEVAKPKTIKVKTK